MVSYILLLLAYFSNIFLKAYNQCEVSISQFFLNNSYAVLLLVAYFHNIFNLLLISFRFIDFIL